MIPIALVTGFLGGGKTTFLQRLVERYRARRLVYLVNEFSEVDIDGQLLGLPPERLVSIPGGSIFCRCLVTEFIGHLRAVAHDQGADLDGVVIEASGVADPRVVAQMLAETRLDRDFRLATVVTIIDPDSFPDLLETLPSIAAQVQAANVAIMNKIDLHGEDRLRAVEAELNRINPSLAVVRAEHCRADLDVFAAATPRRPRGDYALCADPNYARMRLTAAGTIDLTRLTAELDDLRSVIYRLKGFVQTNAGLHHVDVSRGEVAVTPHAGHVAAVELVCIYPPAAARRVQELRARLTSGELSGDGRV